MPVLYYFFNQGPYLPQKLFSCYDENRTNSAYDNDVRSLKEKQIILDQHEKTLMHYMSRFLKGVRLQQLFFIENFM